VATGLWLFHRAGGLREQAAANLNKL
jgi:hypothetical protein